MFYRAVATNGISSIGHAATTADIKTAERPDQSILTLRGGRSLGAKVLESGGSAIRTMYCTPAIRGWGKELPWHRAPISIIDTAERYLYERPLETTSLASSYWTNFSG